MCGFAGLLTRFPSLRTPETLTAALDGMIAPITHRGPDDKGIWCDASSGIGLGFRRLAILDLTEAGHQPMRSSTGRFTMVFNGEVYNFGRLADELRAAGARFRGHSDTEVILAAFERWGVENAVPRFIGMFAIAVWDAELKRLTLIRDHLGIKPLFVYAKDGLVSFGSELKALRAGPAFDATIDLEALTSYLRYLYVPAPRSIFAHAMKLPPGHLLHVDDPSAPLAAPIAYWSAEAAAERGLANPFTGTQEEATDALEQVLLDAVSLQMQSDVPLGALLSGGVDSSLVVALMQASSPRPVETFSIGFDHPEYDESSFAAGVASAIGTHHTQLRVTDADALAVVPELSTMFDEPFADASQIPTYLVCQLAKQSVTVALAGDGGDELFGGYHRYVRGERLVRWVGGTPRPIRKLLGRAIESASPAQWNRLMGLAAPVLPGRLKAKRAGTGERLHMLSGVVQSDRPIGAYRSLVSAWQRPEGMVPGAMGSAVPFERLLESKLVEGLVDRMMLADQSVYLPDDLLTKTDRTSMAKSLEVRVPLLDHRVLEFAWRVPMAMKLRDGHGKRLLREVLYRRVPRELVDRPKMGFEVPLEAWLRGRLRSWGDSLLSPERLRGGELDGDAVRRAWTALQSGQSGLAHPVWGVLMYQAWKERWIGA